MIVLCLCLTTDSRPAGNLGENMNDQELIKKVAHEVMGWKSSMNLPHYLQPSGYTHQPSWQDNDGKFMDFQDRWNPLTNANHCWMVVEKMRELGWEIEITSIEKENPPWDGNWEVMFRKLLYKSRCGDEYDTYFNCNDNLCLAILKATKAAMGGSDDQ